MQNDLQVMANGNEVPFSGDVRTLDAGQHGRGRPVVEDIATLLLGTQDTSYLFRIHGHHWADQGVLDGDIAIVDRGLSARTNDLVISWHDSGFRICRHYQLAKGDEPLGVVTSIIHQYKR